MSESKHMLFAFTVALAILLLAAGYFKPEIQYSIIYAVFLSLNCAMVFAFLPFESFLDYQGIIKASGGASIFLIFLYLATQFINKNYEKNVIEYRNQIDSLKNDLNTKETEIKNLNQFSDASAACKRNLISIGKSSKKN